MSQLTAALDYARAGYAVFPLPPDQKTPHSHSSAYLDGSDDLALTQSRWTSAPSDNIGIATGVYSGIWVFDVDTYDIPELAHLVPALLSSDVSAVREVIEWVKSRLSISSLGAGKIILTPRGGLHFWFLMPTEGPDIRSGSKKFGTRIDIRGTGGYAVAPPSTVDGSPYIPLTTNSPGFASDELLAAIRAVASVENPNVVLTSEDWETLPEDKQFYASRYTVAKADSILSDLLSMPSDSPWGPRVWAAARDLVRLGRTPGTGVSLDDMRDRYLAACESIESDEHDSPSKAPSYWKGALREVTDFEPLPKSVSGPFNDVKPKRFTKDFFGMSDRIRHYAPDQVVWLYDLKKWATYSDRWYVDNGEKAGKLYRDVVETMTAKEGPLYSTDVEKGSKSSEQDMFMDYARSLRNPSPKSSTLDQLKDDSHDTSDNFDTDVNLLGTENGAFDLRTLKLTPLTAAQRITKFCSFKYDPEATCPRWLSFLEQILPNPEDRAYIRRAIAYSFLGKANKKRVFILHGKRDTGKTTLLKTIEYMLSDHATKLNSRAIYEKVRGDQSFDINDAKGKRLVYVSEPTRHNVLDSNVIKDFAGNGTMNSRTLYTANSAWAPIGVLWIDANELPSVDPEEKQIWGRLKVIRFPVQFSDDPGTPKHLLKDTSLDEKLRSEVSGIFNWVVEEIAAYYKSGEQIIEPDSVISASRKYEVSQNNALDYVAEMGETGVLSFNDNYQLRKAELYPHYKKWFMESGEDIRQMLGKQAFNEEIAKVYPTKKSGAEYFTGLMWAPKNYGQTTTSFNGDYLIGDM